MCGKFLPAGMVCSYNQLRTARRILGNWIGVFPLLCNHTDCESLYLSAFIQGLKDNPLSFCAVGSLYWNLSRDLLGNLPVKEPLIVGLHPPPFSFHIIFWILHPHPYHSLKAPGAPLDPQSDTSKMKSLLMWCAYSSECSFQKRAL